MTHFDIGCFTSLYNITRSKELFLRSAESAVFTPMMRTHEGIIQLNNYYIMVGVEERNILLYHPCVNATIKERIFIHNFEFLVSIRTYIMKFMKNMNHMKPSGAYVAL